MKVKIWKFGESDREINVLYGTSVAEALDDAGVRFNGQNVIVNGADASLGDTLRCSSSIHLVPRIEICKNKVPCRSPEALFEKVVDELFLSGFIGIPEYCRFLTVISRRTKLQPEVEPPIESNLIGATLVRKAA